MRGESRKITLNSLNFRLSRPNVRTEARITFFAHIRSRKSLLICLNFSNESYFSIFSKECARKLTFRLSAYIRSRKSENHFFKLFEFSIFSTECARSRNSENLFDFLERSANFVFFAHIRSKKSKNLFEFLERMWSKLKVTECERSECGRN